MWGELMGPCGVPARWRGELIWLEVTVVVADVQRLVTILAVVIVACIQLVADESRRLEICVGECPVKTSYTSVLWACDDVLHTSYKGGGTPGFAWDFQSPLNFRWVIKRKRLSDVSSLASSHKLFDLPSSLYHFRLNRNGDPYWGAQGGKFNSTSFNAPELNKLNSYTNWSDQERTLLRPFWNRNQSYRSNGCDGRGWAPC